MIEESQDGPLLDAEELAALMGVTVEEIRACSAAQKGQKKTQFPTAWIEAGRSRSEIYRQATGRSDTRGAVEFWMRLRGQEVRREHL